MATIGALGGELNIVARHAHTIGAFSVSAKDSSGQPINFTGAIFDSVVKETWEGSSVDSFDITSALPSSGEFTFELPQTRCANLVEGRRYVYLISVTMSGKKNPLIYGSLDLRGA